MPYTSKLLTGSIARSASRRYLVYSEADFEVFRPAGTTRCIDGGEIWRGGGEVPNFTPSVQRVSPAGRKTSKSASE